ncbi:hypothetical protein EON65_47250 [archaeon]|nr:MAG: hypothetical protein EON65_47250 [archaeon]
MSAVSPSSQFPLAAKLGDTAIIYCRLLENNRSKMSIRLYVAHLHGDSSEARLKDLFSNYGSVVSIERRVNYAYVFYDDQAEADKAIEALNGTELDGNKITVEVAGGFRDKAKPVKRFDLRVIVEGLNARVSWQDLKDWARQAGDVTFTNVFTREGIHMGVVEFKVR